MDDLVQFLRARLDEDARSLGEARNPIRARAHAISTQQGTTVLMGADRFRAEVDAKRRLVDEHHDVNDGSCGTCITPQWGYPVLGGSSPQRYPCATLRLLALPYAGHPDYQDTWQP
ncbi:DUF6221 family protein [Streptomyces sp. NPDC126503]|uniref:DUF6221 family protein n=1 Tax=Streptomyces sp. NPDC126503 TaxID=3155315 RepID=UPI003328DF9D